MASMEAGNGGGADMARNHLPDAKPENWIEYFQFKYSRDTASEAREALLVVAALLVQVTFQAGINPPDYISQNSRGDIGLVTSLTVFLVANTVSLSAAMMMIEYLTANMPFQRELRIAMLGMLFGYGWSLGNTQPVSKPKTALLIISMFIPWLVRSLPILVKKIGGK